MQNLLLHTAVGIIFLWCLGFILYIINTGLYRNDGIIFLRKSSAQKATRLRKDLIKFVNDHDLRITVTTNAKMTNFLDVNFDLYNVLQKPYVKDLYNHRYIKKQSNHHPRILNNLHKAAKHRLSTYSINKDMFDKLKGK